MWYENLYWWYCHIYYWCYCGLLPRFIIEGHAQFKWEVGENKDRSFSHPYAQTSLNSIFWQCPEHFVCLVGKSITNHLLSACCVLFSLHPLKCILSLVVQRRYCQSYLGGIFSHWSNITQMRIGSAGPRASRTFDTVLYSVSLSFICFSSL